MKSSAIAPLLVASALALLSCGSDQESADSSCRYEYQCDGSACVGSGSGCASGDQLSTESISDQATCEEYADRKSAEKSATTTTATWNANDGC